MSQGNPHCPRNCASALDQSAQRRSWGQGLWLHGPWSQGEAGTQASETEKEGEPPRSEGRSPVVTSVGSEAHCAECSRARGHSLGSIPSG